MIEAIDSKKSVSPISLLEAMKMLARAWDKVTDKTVQNCFKEAEFSEIEDDDTVSDDQFAALKDSITQFSILDKTFEDITAKNVASFDDILCQHYPTRISWQTFYLLILITNTNPTKIPLNLRFAAIDTIRTVLETSSEM